MSLRTQTPNAPGRQSLWREIAAVLGFKLLALVSLYLLFFDERPDITSGSIEQRMLSESTPTGAAHD